MGASYLCIASKAEVDFNKGLGIASATFANVIIGKHGGAIKELGNEKLDEKKLYNAGTFQIVGSALNICPESIPKNIKNDYEKRLKQLIKKAKNNFIYYLNIELTELSSWILQIASPSIFATESTFNCGKLSLTITGMLLVTITCSNKSLVLNLS